MMSNLKGFKPVPFARSKAFTANCKDCGRNKDSGVLYTNDNVGQYYCNRCLWLYHRIPNDVLVEAEIKRDKEFW